MSYKNIYIVILWGFFIQPLCAMQEHDECDSSKTSQAVGIPQKNKNLPVASSNSSPSHTHYYYDSYGNCFIAEQCTCCYSKYGSSLRISPPEQKNTSILGQPKFADKTLSGLLATVSNKTKK